MDRNLWLAIALSVGVYALWFGFIDKKVNPPPAKPAATTAAQPGAVPGPVDAQPSASKPAVPAPSAALEAKDMLRGAEKVIIGEAEALISPHGAALVSYRFPGPLGRVELVHDAKPGLFASFSELVFERDPLIKNGLGYVATRGDGLKVYKQYYPGEGSLLPRLRVTVANPTRRPIEVGPWTLSIGPGLGTVESEKSENESVWRVIGLTPAAGGRAGRIEDLDAGTHAGPFRWIGVDNRYFLAALVPNPAHFEAPQTAKPPMLTLKAKSVSVPPGGSFPWEIPFYLGPKGQALLARYDMGLERSIDFGYFAQIARAMLSVLEWINRTVNNWGWSIVILTLALQVLLFPLTWKSLKAAASMKKLQPQIAKIQQRYADDPQKMNAETMALYRSSGANPLGGCLPMLLQMPIFIALYNALRQSWELHGAGWLLWIVDLSAKDPYYVLPLVMGALMFLQTKLNPPAGDPAQQQIMLFMPVIFTFMFLNFPSGLVLYWLTNSLVSTVLQLGLKDRLEA